VPTNPILAAKDPSILLNRIKQAFPELTWHESKFIDAGWDHEVIQLDDKYIFRFPNSHEYLPVLKDEIKLLAYLENHTQARIPKYRYVAEDASFAGYNMLSGQELSLAAFTSLDAEKHEIIAKNIADFLSDLHSVSLDDLTSFNIGPEKPFGGYDDVEELALRHIKPNLSADEYLDIDKLLKDIKRVQIYPQPARLTHGDIAPKHLLWDGKTVGFIDFSDRSISDPAMDFAELYTYGEAFTSRVYELYHGPDKTLHFLDRAKAYMKAIGIHALVNVYRSDRITYEEAMQLVQIGAPLQINSGY
jgi:aminoglycoside phosphotransferase (APT) family kinase protein